MYLSDKDIQGKLQEMAIECDNPEHPFSESEQIQPCSLDLRLSNIFWEPVKMRAFDLRRSRLLDLDPRRYWKKRILGKGEYISLKPRKMLLGRIYENLTVPAMCAGKIEGRSSFARMGLSIHCTGDFINPGYRGHVPLQLFNLSPNTIKIYPYIPIGQLMLVQISSLPSRLYGQEELQSKYLDDDGGPSYWWRDKRIRKLQTTFREVDVSIQIQEAILERIGMQEPEIVERFERFIGKTRLSKIDNADTLIEQFVRSEDRLKLKDKLVKGICFALFPILASASIGAVYYEKAFGLTHYFLWVSTVLSLAPFVYVLRDTPKQYLGESELKECLIRAGKA